jgi:hypothetical protein
MYLYELVLHIRRTLFRLLFLLACSCLQLALRLVLLLLIPYSFSTSLRSANGGE